MFSLDDNYIFYCKLDDHHRARKIYRHKIGEFEKEDELIFGGGGNVPNNRNKPSLRSFTVKESNICPTVPYIMLDIQFLLDR